VKFTRASAQRIARVVRTVEAGNRTQGGVEFEHPQYQSSGLKVAKFTGSWATASYKTVTLVGSTNTASVYNWCNPSASSSACTAAQGYVIFGRVSGTNSVLEITLTRTCTDSTCTMTLGTVDLTTFPGYSAGTVQLLGHSAADITTNATACASMQWYSVTTCATA
jgi:hypothetical protein